MPSRGHTGQKAVTFTSCMEGFKTELLSCSMCSPTYVEILILKRGNRGGVCTQPRGCLFNSPSEEHVICIDLHSQVVCELSARAVAAPGAVCLLEGDLIYFWEGSEWLTAIPCSGVMFGSGTRHFLNWLPWLRKPTQPQTGGNPDIC